MYAMFGDGVGQLKIKAFCLLSTDEHGRENGKWVTVKTVNFVTRDEAHQYFQEFKSENTQSRLNASFSYTELFN